MLSIRYLKNTDLYKDMLIIENWQKRSDHFMKVLYMRGAQQTATIQLKFSNPFI